MRSNCNEERIVGAIKLAADDPSKLRRQEFYTSKSRDAGRRARQLRKLGFNVSVSQMGLQITSRGKDIMSMVTVINPGSADIPSPDEVLSSV